MRTTHSSRTGILRLRLTAAMVLAGFFCTAPAGTAESDAAWQAWQDTQSIPMPRPSYEMTLRERIEFGEQRAQAGQRAAVAFLDEHPDDPRRWQMVLLLSSHSPRFVRQWSAEEIDGRPVPAVVDDTAAMAWGEYVRVWKTRMAAAELPAELRARVIRQQKMQPFYDSDPHYTGRPVDMPALLALIDTEIAADTVGGEAETMVDSYMGLLARREPRTEQVMAQWSKFAASAHAGVRRRAEGRLRFHDLSQHPLEIAFTAVDGRQVDLKDLRGKVVLLHFWATWCGSCVAEMPAVKAAYEKYHLRGLEIVGISSDRDRQKLIDYTSEQQMPWPQHFEEAGGKNHFTARYGITGIPTKFLLDRSGMLASDRVSGATLDKEIGRLLGP